jgi:hypothetical protein
MRVEMTDYRAEHRDVSVRVGIDGERLPDVPATKYGGTRSWERSYESEETADRRTVEIWFEEGDDVPEVLDPNEHLHFGQVFPFFVSRAKIVYRRDNTAGKSYKRVGAQWVRDYFEVSGANRRKDGSSGEKPQTLKFPTRSKYETGEYWTEADVTVEPGKYLYKPQMERVGKPKLEDRNDPIPAWLAAIEAQASPETGVPFVHGEEHRFGDFGSAKLRAKA